MNVLFVLLMEPAEGGNPISSLLPFVLIAVVFYFFMIRPQRKKQKELEEFRNSIKKGDKIVTTGGIHGRVTDVKDKTMIIEVEGGMKIKMERSAVSLENTSGSGEAK